MSCVDTDDDYASMMSTSEVSGQSSEAGKVLWGGVLLGTRPSHTIKRIFRVRVGRSAGGACSRISQNALEQDPTKVVNIEANVLLRLLKFVSKKIFQNLFN